MTCADCGHPRTRHIPVGPRGCTGYGRGWVIVWCDCEGWHDTTPSTGRPPTRAELDQQPPFMQDLERAA